MVDERNIAQCIYVVNNETKHQLIHVLTYHVDIKHGSFMLTKGTIM